MGAKCTHPSDSFLICGLRIMCLMLHNKIFLFLRPLLIWITLAVSLFLFLLILLYLSLFQCFSPSLSHLCLIIFRHQIESKFVFWIQHKCRFTKLLLQRGAWCSSTWQQCTSLTVHSEIPFNLSHLFLFSSCSYAAWVCFQGMMIDSSLIYMTEFCPADAGKKAPGPRSESGAVSVQTWPPDVPICPSVCWTYFLQSATGNRKARRISPSLPSFSFWSLSGCLFVCSATATSSFFSQLFKPRRENAICTHTSDVLHLSQPARQPLTVIK